MDDDPWGQIPRKKKPPLPSPVVEGEAAAAAINNDNGDGGGGGGGEVMRASHAVGVPVHHQHDDALFNNMTIPKKKRPRLPTASSPPDDGPAAPTRTASANNSSQYDNALTPRRKKKNKRDRTARPLSLSPSCAPPAVQPTTRDNNNNNNSGHCRVRITCHMPLIVTIDVTGMEGLLRARRSTSVTTKKRTYHEAEHGTDDDGDFLTDTTDEDDLLPVKPPARRQASTGQQGDGDGEDVVDDDANDPAFLAADGAGIINAVGVMDPNAIEGPPPGVLSTLYYSNEAFLNAWVLEKACGWKTRSRARLVKLKTSNDEEEGQVPHAPPATAAVDFNSPPEAAAATTAVTLPVPDETIDHKSAPLVTMNGESHEDQKATQAETDGVATDNGPSPPPPPTKNVVTDAQGELHELWPVNKADAVAWQSQALHTASLWADARRRMEVSRLEPHQCPVVLALLALHEEHQAAAQGRPVRFKLQVLDREDVILVKWRGRSHLHCSWERPSEVQKMDLQNNVARNKLKRFYQHQEMLHGPHWKQILEEERLTAATIHAHGAILPADAPTVEEEADQEEFFPPQVLEIERILACDESEMNMELFARQRALNIAADENALQRREADNTAVSNHDVSAPHTGELGASIPVVDPATVPIFNVVKSIVDSTTKGIPWDPEDNVRYVVKWKGLSFAEITWEYWRDIKQEAVDEAEDFWWRQEAPDPELVKSKPHPHIRDFRKLQESPSYGLCTRRRPITNLGGGPIVPDADEDGDTFKSFQLRSYQLEGVNWLLFNYWNKRSCILADEMGLGKTIQSAAFLQELQANKSTQVRGPFLIVAPLTLVGQWQSELKSWAPDMNVVLYHGSADARDFLVQNEFYYTEQFAPKPLVSKLKKQHVTKFHVLITTYEVVLKDIAVLSKVRWRVLIVDEAHRLKNSKARLFEQLATVPRDYCVLLTGTPIANATEELWALLHFASPQSFADKEGFLEKFGQMTDSKQVNELHSILKPFLLRRVKEDVEKSLPPKQETILEVSLTPIQKTFYKAIYERNTAFLFKGSKPSNAPSLMNVMMELRKCCNHPYLVKGAEERIVNDAAAKLREQGDGGGNIVIDHMKLFGDQLIKSSGKMVLMDKLLHKLFVGGHKVLVFSQMVRVLDLLEELLKLKKYKYERLDGTTSSSSRASAVDRFNRMSLQRFVMLLSTRAGGLGLNLTSADIVIIFDSDWNPQVL